MHCTMYFHSCVLFYVFSKVELLCSLCPELYIVLCIFRVQLLCNICPEMNPCSMYVQSYVLFCIFRAFDCGADVFLLPYSLRIF